MADLRASDEDRERVAREIRDHFAAGRLDRDELDDRLQAVVEARTVGELAALREDLPAPPADLRAELARRRGELRRDLLQQSGGALGPFVLCTVLWAATGASGFFWPVFLLFAVVVPLVRNGWRLYGPSPELDRVEEELRRRRRSSGPRSPRHGPPRR
jgi:hypothetical protein